MVEYKGQNFSIKKLKYKDWLKLAIERKQAIEKNDVVDIFQSIKHWTMAITDCPETFFDDLTTDEIVEFQNKINESESLPLPKNESSAGQ